MYFFSVYLGIIFKLGYKHGDEESFILFRKDLRVLNSFIFPKYHYLVLKERQKIHVYNNNQNVAPGLYYLTLFAKV